MANHAVPLGNNSNTLLRLSLLPVRPCILIAFRNFSKLSIQFHTLSMVVGYTLLPMRAEAILVQWVDVNGIADTVSRTEIYFVRM